MSKNKNRLSEAESLDKAKTMAEKLGESGTEAIQTIQRIYQVLDETFVEEMYSKTEYREANGGMLTMDKKRRRSKGGVFFQLVKDAIPGKFRDKIFLSNEDQSESKETNPETTVIDQSEKARKLSQLRSNLASLKDNAEKLASKGKDPSLTLQLIARTEKHIARIEAE